MMQDLYNYFTQRIHKRDNNSRDQLYNKVQVLSTVVLYTKRTTCKWVSLVTL